MNNSFFDTKLEFLKGVGTARAALLGKELGIFTYADIIQHYPFRHEDRTEFHKISDISEEMPYVQFRGKIKFIETVGEGAKARLVAYFRDGTGEVELIWFRGIEWVKKGLQINTDYIIFGKPAEFNGKYSITHPEIEPLTNLESQSGFLQPVITSQKLCASVVLIAKASARS